jgi:ATP-dependent Lhr-like helicase
VLEHLEQSGACYAAEIETACRLLPAETEEALGELIVTGLASCDAPGPVRRLVAGDGRRRRRPPVGRFARQSGRVMAIEGRYWRLDPPPLDPEEALQAHAAQLLRRYGVMFRDLLAREAAPPWRDLLNVLRRAEARGEVRGGRFVAGFSGEQFALAEAVDALREERRKESSESGILIVSACDPLNLAGVVVPGPRVPAVSGNRVVLENGVLVGSRQSEGRITLRPDVDPATAERARVLLQARA